MDNEQRIQDYRHIIAKSREEQRKMEDANLPIIDALKPLIIDGWVTGDTLIVCSVDGYTRQRGEYVENLRDSHSDVITAKTAQNPTGYWFPVDLYTFENVSLRERAEAGKL